MGREREEEIGVSSIPTSYTFPTSYILDHME
jgi:hypothetical protein